MIEYPFMAMDLFALASSSPQNCGSVEECIGSSHIL